MLFYSNHAATRISLGRMKEALGDCLMVANIDPRFLKAQVRAAQYLLLRLWSYMVFSFIVIPIM